MSKRLTSSSPPSRKFTLSFLTGFLCFFGMVKSNAQCPQSLGCNDNIQISLDYQCFAVITPELILEDERDNCGYIVTISTEDDKVIDQTTIDTNGDFNHPVIDGSFVGAPYKASVSFVDDNGVTISCWGWFTVEDKLPPQVTCIEDITVDCTKDLTELFTSSNIVTYCTDSNVDTDMSDETISLILTPTGSGTCAPWEVINNISFSLPGTGSGIGIPMTGSGTGIVLGTGSFGFEEDPVDENVYTGEISGVQTKLETFGDQIVLVLEDTPANQARVASGICVDFNTVSFFRYQQEDNCDPNVEVILNKDETEHLECSDASDISARRDIEYYTRDDAGSVTDLCEFSIFFERKELTDIDFPLNMDFSCDDPDILDDNGIVDLSPENTGQPSINGFPLSDEDNICKINVTFEDDTFSLCGINSVKILRKWTALDWCEGEYAQSYQTIKVEDANGPDFEIPDGNLRFQTGVDCEASVVFKPLSLIDTTGVENLSDCSVLNDLDVTVEYLPGLVTDPINFNREFYVAVEVGDGFRAENLQAGSNTIRYILTDECGNSTSKEFIIQVYDSAPPVPICDQFTAVSLADNGWARLYAAAVDDGSFDECGGPVVLQVKKDTTLCDSLPGYDRDGTEFGDYVQFCCAEGGDTVSVVMRVTDQGGLHNECNINVIVQDKTGVVVEACPGQLEFNLSCTEKDNIDPLTTGMPVISGDCGIGDLRYEDSGSIDEVCGDGVIVRKWFVDLPSQSIELTNCEQTFRFTNNIPLSINNFVWPNDRNDASCFDYSTDLGDKVWYIEPEGDTVSLLDANLCAHLSYSFTDRVFQNVEGYCVKVIRTWTVIDFCTYDVVNNPGEGIWSRTQVIKVSESEGPELTNCPGDLMFGIQGSECEYVLNLDAPDAFDMCSQEVVNMNAIQYDISLNGNTVHQGNGSIVNDTLAAGIYNITWSVTGICGVPSVCTHLVEIVDDKAPVPYCQSGITVVISPPVNSNLEPYVEIWANDLVIDQIDNCDNNVQVSFDSLDLDQTSIRFACEDVGTQVVQVWFTDNSGNQDFCVTSLTVQANAGVCQDTIGTGMMVAGSIATEYNEELTNVNVSLQRMLDEYIFYDRTNVNGRYSFFNNDTYQDYRVNVLSEDDYLNGVSTLDLLFIQRHILGLEQFDSPYKIIAADINNNEEISATDLVELRKLILGIYDELPSNESWRFVNQDQNFNDVLNPWPLDEDIDIYDLQVDNLHNDFIGVKVGDINESVSLDGGKKNSRFIHEFTLKTDVEKLENNERGYNRYVIPVRVSEDINISGFQLSLIVGDKDVEVVNVYSDNLEITDNHYFISNGKFNMSWTQPENGEFVNANDVLLNIEVQSKKVLNSTDIRINTKTLTSEIYDDGFNTYSVILDNSVLSMNELYQNSPNPFNESTEIIFESSTSIEGVFSVFNTNGELIKSYKSSFNKGKNSILLTKNDFGSSGIYYYKIETGNYSNTKKLILID